MWLEINVFIDKERYTFDWFDNSFWIKHWSSMKLQTGLKSSWEAVISLNKYLRWLLLNVVLKENFLIFTRSQFEDKPKQKSKINVFRSMIQTFFALPWKVSAIKQDWIHQVCINKTLEPLHGKCVFCGLPRVLLRCSDLYLT